MAKKEDRQLAQTPTDGRFLATLLRKAKHSKELKEPLLNSRSLCYACLF